MGFVLWKLATPQTKINENIEKRAAVGGLYRHLFLKKSIIRLSPFSLQRDLGSDEKSACLFSWKH